MNETPTHYIRRASVACPGPSSSLTASRRPVIAIRSASPVPLTSGPSPCCQETSVAVSRSPLMRRPAPSRGFVGTSGRIRSSPSTGTRRAQRTASQPPLGCARCRVLRRICVVELPFDAHASNARRGHRHRVRYLAGGRRAVAAPPGQLPARHPHPLPTTNVLHRRCRAYPPA
jgi:hypothetical protein